MTTLSWQQELSLAIANAVRGLRSQLEEEELFMFAVDCHPWNGGLYLAALTQSEVEEDPLLAAPAEMAAWGLYDFTQSNRDWNVEALCETMKSDYDSSDDKDTTARRYLQACAAALADESVQTSLRELPLHEDFRLSVAHPEDDTEYCT